MTAVQWLLLLPPALLAAQAPDAEEIMRRVAANQDRASEARARYVYQQRVAMRMVDSKNRVRREETAEYVMTPAAKGTTKDLTSFRGSYYEKGRAIPVSKPGEEAEGRRIDLDGEILDGLRDDLTNDQESRDGLRRRLFPMTSSELPRYQFTLKSEEQFQGTPVYRIAFAPRRREKGLDTESGPWTGEALVSRDEFQPVLISTKLARKVPTAVRALLGVNLSGLGFSVTYKKFEDGVWFPVSYGTEFFLRLFFRYSRTIVVNLTNDGFRRTDVASTITFDDQPQ